MKSVTHLMCFPTCWIRLALCLAILDMIPPLTGAATKVSARTAENQTSEVLETWEVLAARLLASQLNPNGTLNLATGLRGRRLTSRQGEAPRFAPLNAPGDENWAGNFVLNGITGDVSAMAVSGSNIYVGGSFTTAGGVIANNIAKWDGNTWQPLGSGVSDSACSYSPCVSAIAVDSSGNVYVGGNFTAAGNVSANHIAKWNVSTNSWSALGSGIGGTDAQVNALAIDGNGNLYVGGGFSTAGSVGANNVAMWNGSSWSPLNSGIGGDIPVILALAVDANNNLYAGGYFTTIGGVSASLIAKWDGSNWSALGSGVYGGGIYRTSCGIPCVAAIAIDNNGNVYAGGTFTTAGGVSVNNIARWNGNNWSGLGGGMSGCYYLSCVNALRLDVNGNLYAGGSFTTAGNVTANYIAKWNGNSWLALGYGIGNDPFPYVNTIAVDSGGNMYTGGRFGTAGGMIANNIAKWNGSTWSPLGTINNSVNSSVYALAVNGSDVYAGGPFVTGGSVIANSIVKWNGSNWSPLWSGLSGGNRASPYSPPVTSLSALAIDGNGNVYAGGNFTKAGGGSANYIAKWNGSNWSALGDGITDCNIYDKCVYAAAVDAVGNIYVGGYFWKAGSVAVNSIAKWNGSSWEALGNGVIHINFSGAVNTLAIDKSGNLFAGGWFTGAGAVNATNVAMWNGSNWSALGNGIGGIDDQVYALAVDGNGNLYAGGRFSTAGGIAASNVAKWNGSSWSALGSGLGGCVSYAPCVYALAVDASGNLYAGGAFTTAGGVPANYVAKWNGSSWLALGSGMNSAVYALAVQGSNIYAGGSFTTAGDKASAYIARWATAPTVFNFSKLGDKNQPIVFIASDFSSHFTGVGSNSLVKIKITSLPDHGTLKLNGSVVSLNQEIAVADLNKLIFTPVTDWLGTTSFGWNGSDGSQYASNGASVTMTVAVLKYIYFPIIFR